jgi:hypothetical protein
LENSQRGKTPWFGSASHATQFDAAMKQSLILTAAVSAAVWLVAGCEQAEQAPPPRVVHHKPKTDFAQKPKPVKPPKLVLPGTADYLDLKNGFRDVVFGTSESSLSDLVLKEKDDAGQSATYIRSGDLLTLEDVPLQTIEYTFYKSQLAKITVKWKQEFATNDLALPPSTGLAANCTKLYGRPKLQQVQHGASQYVWAGQKVKIQLYETKLPGVADPVGGSWAIPPVTSGVMTIESLPLQRDMDFYSSSQSTLNKTGL